MAGRRTRAADGAYTVPGMSPEDGKTVADMLQERLVALTDLSLTLKHIHWNVVGPHFIAVHQMLDPQVDAVRLMADATAERIATLGHEPIGTPGALVKARGWDDYSLGRADALAHLGALDVVYTALVADHRVAMDKLEELDLVSQDMLISQSEQLEQFHWFVRAHLENAAGELSTAGAATERGAARRTGRS